MRVGLFTLEKNPRFTAFLDSNLHTRLAIVTGNELGLAFPPRNLPKKFRPDPSTFYLVIVVTDKQTEKQTDRQTYAGDSIIPRESFRGIMTGAVFRLNIGPIVRLFLTAIILADSVASRHISVCRASAVCLSVRNNRSSLVDNCAQRSFTLCRSGNLSISTRVHGTRTELSWSLCV